MDKKKQNIKPIILILFLSLLLIILLAFLIFFQSKNRKDINTNLDSSKIILTNGKSEEKLNILIANNAEERRVGFMNRKSIDKDLGMLFVFDNEEPRAFWMKDTLVPLDMIFFDKDGKFINVQRNAEPCISNGDNCTSYYSAKPAKYVLETNAGRLNDAILTTDTQFTISNSK